ncbi:hypothetical protein SDIAM26S_04853 [Streptomyces diastaticus subsp. diastaticus]
MPTVSTGYQRNSDRGRLLPATVGHLPRRWVRRSGVLSSMYGRCRHPVRGRVPTGGDDGGARTGGAGLPSSERLIPRSSVRTSRVVPSGGRILGVRRILLGHSPPSRVGRVAPHKGGGGPTGWDGTRYDQVRRLLRTARHHFFLTAEQAPPPRGRHGRSTGDARGRAHRGLRTHRRHADRRPGLPGRHSRLAVPAPLRLPGDLRRTARHGGARLLETGPRPLRRSGAPRRRPAPLSRRLPGPGVGVGHTARFCPRDRFHAPARRRPAGRAHRGGPQRARPDALGPAHALLVRPGRAVGAPGRRAPGGGRGAGLRVVRLHRRDARRGPDDVLGLHRLPR